MKTTTSRPPTIEINPFTVTTEWVKVTIRLSRHDAEFLDSQNDTVRNGIGDDVFLFSCRARRDFEAKEGIEGFKGMIAVAGRLTKGDASPFSFDLISWKWKEVEQTAAILSTTPEHVARAAIVSRLSQIREFHRTSTKKGGTA